MAGDVGAVVVLDAPGCFEVELVVLVPVLCSPAVTGVPIVLVVEPGCDEVDVDRDERWLAELHEAAIRPHVTNKDTQPIFSRRRPTSVAIPVLTAPVAVLFRWIWLLLLLVSRTFKDLMAGRGSSSADSFP